MADLWFSGKKENLSLPPEKWDEFAGLLDKATAILQDHSRPFDNKTIPEGETRNSVRFFSNVVIREKPEDG